MAGLPSKAAAISFAFPGPADFERGIIGDLTNLPSFRGGVALKDMLERHFKLPVFIQNDGDLYTYGEAIGGILPEINQTLKNYGSIREYKNLIGITLGTGFGAGMVNDGKLLTGDNNMGLEIWNTSNSISPHQNAEEGVSTRALISDYYKFSDQKPNDITPKDIYDISMGNKERRKSGSCTKIIQKFWLPPGRCNCKSYTTV